ncbi:GTPase Era [bacterium]|nr:GTPase Era [bacterium]
MENIDEFKSGFVAIVGRPNVGKSTLINALMGQKIAAVSPRPQTTRRQQLGILTTDTAQIIFTDTPGIHHAKHKLGNFMNEEAVLALEDSDIVLFLVDGSVSPDPEDLYLAEIIRDLNRKSPTILGVNKIDRVSGNSNLEKYTALVPSAIVFEFSALQGTGIDDLIVEIEKNLPEHPPFFPLDQITDLYERDIAADLIREAALNILRDEVPHSIAVRIDEFSERENGVAYIEATLFVERDSQKGIVIGANGAMIKKIGTVARQSIEEMSDRKVFLRLRVKVRKNWRNDLKSLNLFGFRGSGKGL